jgi:WD40 repeat protein
MGGNPGRGASHDMLHHIRFLLRVLSVLAVSASQAPAQNATNATTPQVVVDPERNINYVAVSPDGNHILSANEVPEGATFWDAETGKPFRNLENLGTYERETNSVAFSPDGRRMLTGNSGAAVKLWDAESGQLLRTYGTLTGAMSVAFSPDGRKVLSGHCDKTLRLWETETAKLLKTFEGHSRCVKSALFSFDGHQILSLDDANVIRLWDIATGMLVRTFEPSTHLGKYDNVKSAIFSPDGHLAVAAHGENIELWDVATGKSLRTFEGRQSAAFSPDGRQLLTGSKENAIKVWDVSTGQLLRTMGKSVLETRKGAAGVNSVLFSSDGRKILSRQEGFLDLWDASTGELLKTYAGYANGQLVLSPDGHKMLSAGLARPHNSAISRWDIRKGKRLPFWEEYSAASIKYSSDGKAIIAAYGSCGEGSSTETVRDAMTGEEIYHPFDCNFDDMRAVFFPDGHRVLFSRDRTLYLGDATTRSEAQDFSFKGGHSEPIKSIAISPDGRMAVSGSKDGALKLWSTNTRQVLKTLKGHSGEVVAAAFSPDGRWVLSASSDVAKLWDVKTGKLLKTFQGQGYDIHEVAFASEGRTILTEAEWFDNRFTLWDLKAATPIRTNETKSREGVAVVSPNGHQLLATENNTLALWNAETGERIRGIGEQLHGIASAAFSTDGRQVITAGPDGAIRLWAVDTGEQLLTFVLGKNAEWLAVTPAGFFDASADGAKLAHIVHGLKTHPLEPLREQLRRPDLIEELLKGDPEGRYKTAAAKLNLGTLIDASSTSVVGR